MDWTHWLLAFAVACLVAVLLKLLKQFLFPKQLKVVPVDDMDRPPAPRPAAANRNPVKASATIAPTIEETHADAQHMFNTPLPNIDSADPAPAEEPKGEPESKGDEPGGASMEEPDAIARADSEAGMDTDEHDSMHIGKADAEHLFNTPLPGQADSPTKKKKLRRKRSSTPGAPMDMPTSFTPLPSVASVLELKKQKSMTKLKAMKSFGVGKGAFGGIGAGQSAKIGIATDEGASSDTSTLLREKGGLSGSHGGAHLPSLERQPVRFEVGQAKQPEPTGLTDSAPGPDGATEKKTATVVVASGMAAEEDQAEALRKAAEEDARKATDEAARRREEKLKAYRDATSAAAGGERALGSIFDDAAEDTERAAAAAAEAEVEAEQSGSADSLAPMHRAAAPPMLGAATWNVESMSDLLGPSSVALDPLTLDAPARPAPGTLAQAALEPEPFARDASAMGLGAAGSGDGGGGAGGAGGGGGGGGAGGVETQHSTGLLAKAGERAVQSSLFEHGGAAASPKGAEEGGGKKKFQRPGGFGDMRAETFKDLDFDDISSP